MGRQFCALFVCLITLPLLCQTASSNPQRVTITAVKVHQNDAEDDARAEKQYDISLKARDGVYVVLYTPPSGSNGAEYSTGMDLLVMIGSTSITFTKFGRTSVVPILSRVDAPAYSGIDWSRISGGYFSEKLQHLSIKLNLTPEQQAKIKPILEQESGEVREISPVLSRKDKLSAVEKIVRASDEKLKPILSTDQWHTLQEIRKEQKRELRNSPANNPKNQG